MNSKQIPEKKILEFCSKILPGFHTIIENLEELAPGLSPHVFAMNLMELGRVEMSGIADPDEQDVEFISGYIESLNLNHTEEAYFTAYAGGCIMGLVMINEVAREDFGRALRLIEHFAHQEFSG